MYRNNPWKKKKDVQIAKMRRHDDGKFDEIILVRLLGRVVRRWVKITKFELRYQSLKNKFSLILFAYIQFDDWIL